MKHLFYFNWMIKLPHLGVVLDELDIVCKDPKNEIDFVFCRGAQLPCYSNMEGDLAICNQCNFISNTVKKKYRGRVNFLSIDELIAQLPPKEYKADFTFNTLNEIKEINYRGAFIGYSALSGYISKTRNLEPDLGAEFREYFDVLLINQMKMADALIEFVDTKKVDQITCFNARTSDVRPVYDLAMHKGIPVNVLELIYESKAGHYKDRYVNSMPHSIKYHTDRIHDLWEKSTLGLEEKIESGSTFFKNRRSSILTRDVRAYSKEQEKGLIPDSISQPGKNIVFYLSSEDEFVAVNKEFDDIQVFESQEAAIHKILSAPTEEPVKYYLRLHPNLKNVDYGYHHRLYDLPKKYPNVEVIGAKSKIDSYVLLDHADLVITFGSTVCAEACYWGKPVILLGGEYFYYLDVAYLPKSLEEVMELVNDIPEPKDQVNAVKFGYYQMNYPLYTVKSAYSPEPVNVLGKPRFYRIPYFNWLDYVKFKSRRSLDSTWKPKASNKKYKIPNKEKSYNE